MKGKDTMKNFLIGMPGGFDYKKFKRDFREDFFGIEASMFKDEDDIRQLIEEVKNNNIRFGVHFPLRKGVFSYCRDPLFLSLDKGVSEKSYEVFEKEVEHCSKIGAEYLLVHFPKPVLIDRKLDWSSWRFANDMEWMYEEVYPIDLFRTNLGEMFERLSCLSEQYKLQILLEHDAVNRYLYDTDLLESLLCKYPNIKICLDTGRLHLLELVDREFNAKNFIQRMAPFTYLVHLWNTNPKDNAKGGHYPALPDLEIGEGWGDIGGYLKAITSVNRNIKILFEHQSDLISEEKLEICYQWVESFFK